MPPKCFDAGANTGTFTISRTGSTTATDGNLQHWRTATKNGTDYTKDANSVVIPAGQSSATVTSLPFDDSVVEQPNPPS